MEILIVGVALVAFMVFISTKIKKSAAAAFERETIETENFTIVKPEGFINPIEEHSSFAFESYTKEFGKNDAEEMRQASANIFVLPDSNFKTALENIRKTDGKILSEQILQDAPRGQKICLIGSETSERDIAVCKFYKIIETDSQHKVYQLQISILHAYLADYTDRLNEMLESFAVK